VGRSVRLVSGEDGRPSIEWTGDSRWLHVSIGLLGQVGAMRAIGPTLKLPDQVPPTVSLISLPFACARKRGVKLLLAEQQQDHLLHLQTSEACSVSACVSLGSEMVTRLDILLQGCLHV
jgi:hypothetical protein